MTPKIVDFRQEGNLRCYFFKKPKEIKPKQNQIRRDSFKL